MPDDRVSDDVAKGALMACCRTCGATIPEARCDVYCVPCLGALYEDLAEALLRAFMDRRWSLVEGRPRGERWRRWWKRSA